MVAGGASCAAFDTRRWRLQIDIKRAGGMVRLARDYTIQRWWHRRNTLRELETTDARLPVRTRGRFVIFLRVPEGAVVGRVHRHCAIIAPAVKATNLRTAAFDE